MAQAKSELAAKASYTKIKQLLADELFAEALTSYSAIRRGSRYKATARLAIAKASPNLVVWARDTAEHLAMSNRCPELEKLVRDLRSVDVEPGDVANVSCPEPSWNSDTPFLPESRRP